MKPAPGILSLRTAIATGATTVDQALQHSFDLAHQWQPRLHAFCHLPESLDTRTAWPCGPLAGIAVAVKDMMDTADMPTTYGSPLHRQHRPDQDAWVVRRLRQLGAHVLGKSVTTEFAWRQPGNTVNPWNPDHTPGGSSSGSAAAVAAGITPLALGTQTLGSVIRPAAYCGVVGFKPSYGAIPRTGICPLAGSLDHVGLFTRNVDDAVYAASLLMGQDAGDVHGTPPPAYQWHDVVDAAPAPLVLRLAVPDTAQWGDIESCQANLLSEVASRLAEAGAQLMEINLPAEFTEASALAVSIMAFEAARIHARRADRFSHLLSEHMLHLIEQGQSMSVDDYLNFRERQQALEDSYRAWRVTNRVDAVLLPPATGEAPKGLAYTGDPRFCSPMTLIGAPAITLPAGLGPNGMPLGVQLAGGIREDAALLRAARWCESVIAYQPARLLTPPAPLFEAAVPATAASCKASADGVTL